MKNLFLSVLILFTIGCTTNTVSKANLQHLNGYWEIEKVIFPDGTTKEYKASTTIDFLKFDSLSFKGIRKKVQPKIGGAFLANKDIDSLQITEKEGIFSLFLKNRDNLREEQITSISETRFSVKDSENTTYLYKRHIPIIIE